VQAVSYERGTPVQEASGSARALPAGTKVESGTSQSKSGTCVNLSNSGIPYRKLRAVRASLDAIGFAMESVLWRGTPLELSI